MPLHGTVRKTLLQVGKITKKCFNFATNLEILSKDAVFTSFYHLLPLFVRNDCHYLGALFLHAPIHTARQYQLH